MSQQGNSNKQFIVGLIVGLVVGMAAGVVLPPLLESKAPRIEEPRDYRPPAYQGPRDILPEGEERPEEMPEAMRG